MKNHQNLTSKLQLLIRNYKYLFDLYRRSKFEVAIDSKKFQFHDPLFESALSKMPPTIKPAANDLYALACFLEEDLTVDAEHFSILAEYILRSKVLSYEIDDYFLDVQPSKSTQFIQMAKDISDDFQHYFTKHYSSVAVSEKQRKIKQYLLLNSLCGINELYRKHHINDYQEGIERGEKILAHINNELCPPRSGLGVRGLCYYILGRLSLALGEYQDAASYFRQSVEDYSERVRIKDKEFKQEEERLSLQQRNVRSFRRHRERFEAARLATLRRCALASSFGNAYQSLIEGKVSEAINLSALSRSILRQNCGEIYLSYADLIYWSAKRAAGSSNEENLKNVIKGMQRCRRTFQLYVPNTHYIHQAGIQLAIAYHYLAKEKPYCKSLYYKRAITYLEKAIDFAKTGSQGRPRNQRMLAEALSILSHILSNLGSDSLELALEKASEALTASKGIEQFTCESYLALASIYSVMARESSELEKAAKNIKAARDCIVDALRHNKDMNARIRATCYLRLAALSFLQKSTLPEARHFYEKWLMVKGFVEHDFLNKWGEKIETQLLDTDDRLVIDTKVSFNVTYWNQEVEEYLLSTAMRDLANELRLDQNFSNPQKSNGIPVKARQAKLSSSQKDKMRTRIRNYLMAKFEMQNATAYKKISDYKLIEKLNYYLH